MTQASDTPAPNRMFALLTPLQTERWRQPEANVFNAPGPSITLLVASAAAPQQQQQLDGTCFAVFYAGVDQTTEHKRGPEKRSRRPSRPARRSPRRPPPGLRCWQPGPTSHLGFSEILRAARMFPVQRTREPAGASARRFGRTEASVRIGRLQEVARCKEGPVLVLWPRTRR